MNNLDDFYDELKYLHKTYFPELRFGQFMLNVFNTMPQDPFFVKNNVMIEKIRKWVDNHKSTP